MSDTRGKTVGNNLGITLMELLVVLGILAALLLSLGASYQGWMEKHKVEGATKTLYADLMNARARAVQRNRVHFVSVASSGYSTFEDTNTVPDGNGVFESALDTRIVNAASAYPIASSLGMPLQFSFSPDGLSSVTCWVRFSSTINEPDYDCITIKPTRINLGVFHAATNACLEK